MYGEERRDNGERGRSTESVGAGEGTAKGSIRSYEKRKMMDISIDY